MARESIMDMDLTERIRQIQKDEGRVYKEPIEVAGPAGNPTFQIESQVGCAHDWIPITTGRVCTKCGMLSAVATDHCGSCGQNWRQYGHAASCSQAPQPDVYYDCG